MIKYICIDICLAAESSFTSIIFSDSQAVTASANVTGGIRNKAKPKGAMYSYFFVLYPILPTQRRNHVVQTRYDTPIYSKMLTINHTGSPSRVRYDAHDVHSPINISYLPFVCYELYSDILDGVIMKLDQMWYCVTS